MRAASSKMNHLLAFSVGQILDVKLSIILTVIRSLYFMVDQTETKKVVHLLLKGDIQDSEYVEEFKRKNLTALSVPVLNFEYQHLDELAELLQASRSDADGKQFHGLIITSPRVVEALARALTLIDAQRRCGILERFHPDYIFVVGHKTGQECIAKLGLGYNKLSAGAGNSQNLLTFIRNLRNAQADKSTFHLIYPKGSRSDNSVEDELNDLVGMRVVAMVVYKTMPSSNIQASIFREISQMSIPQSINILVVNLIFFSPSGVEGFFQTDHDNFIEQIRGKFPSQCYIEVRYSSIGMTTKAALSQNNRLVSCVSDQPNPNSLVKSILACNF